MKKTVIYLLMLVPFYGVSQSSIQFQYDQAGNQIMREMSVVCLSCTRDRKNGDVESSGAKGELNQAAIDEIIFYPNPVEETLYIEWQYDKERTLDKISVYTLKGDLLSVISGLQDSQNATVAFSGYAAGYYTVIFSMSNGQQKSAKILKK